VTAATDPPRRWLARRLGGHAMIPFEIAGAYGMIKQAEILHALSSSERQEFDRLDRRANRTTAQDERVAELWVLATELHRQQRSEAPPLTPENDLVLFAQETGKRMRARSRIGGS
jgi:hypothetical protein